MELKRGTEFAHSSGRFLFIPGRVLCLRTNHSLADIKYNKLTSSSSATSPSLTHYIHRLLAEHLMHKEHKMGKHFGSSTGFPGVL